MGYGQTLIDAFDFASHCNFDWIITIDCDFQHEPSYLPRFYSEIEKANCDIISGSRYLKPIINHNSLFKTPTDRIIINRLVTQILNDNLGVRLTDSFCGFKACRIQPLSGLGLNEQGYGFPLQFLIRSIRTGLRVREIPVPLIYIDPTRCFGADLDDPTTRIRHYREIIERELGYDISKDIRGCFHSERQKLSFCKTGPVSMADATGSEQDAHRHFSRA
jgi:dolichol-phosphate mannosyltransferase